MASMYTLSVALYPCNDPEILYQDLLSSSKNTVQRGSALYANLRNAVRTGESTSQKFASSIRQVFSLDLLFHNLAWDPALNNAKTKLKSFYLGN